MDYYFAPMEGVTTYIFRREHARLFPGCRKYYAPFITACQPGGLKASQLRDVLPENNEGAALVPQLLSNDAPSFLRALSQLRELGWGEVNLNLGCPSGTVASRPNEIDLTAEGGYRTVVKARIFLGDYTEYRVDVGNQEVRIQSTGDRSFMVGDSVGLDFTRVQWYSRDDGISDAERERRKVI